jgi:hypothetical protein
MWRRLLCKVPEGMQIGCSGINLSRWNVPVSLVFFILLVEGDRVFVY